MNRSTIIILVVGIVIVGGLVFAASRSKSASNSTESTSTPTPSPTVIASPTPTQEVSMEQSPSTSTTAANGLVIEDQQVGTGAEATTGSTVSVHYVGTFPDGTKFDSSRDRNQPFSFTVGGGQVIQGWDQGLVGMKVGGKRKLTVPPTLGYGDRANGPIPANSTLVFEIELLDVK